LALNWILLGRLIRIGRKLQRMNGLYSLWERDGRPTLRMSDQHENIVCKDFHLYVTMLKNS
jgi:hypothetical protein